MTGVFHKSLKNLAMSLLGGIAISVVLVSCSGKVAENAELGWKVEVAGGAQITLPRRPFGSPVEIKIVDVSGQPVGDAVMEYRLVEAKDLGSEDNVSADVLAKAWDTPKAAMTSSDSAIKNSAAAALAGKTATVSNADGSTSTKKPEDEIEESVGRIEQFDARTSKEGKARVWIFAPTGFNKKIAVLAKAGRDAKFKPLYTHAVLSTSDTKGGARLTLSTSGSRKEKAGDEFDIWLNVRDNSDRIATSFEGVKTVKFDAAPQTSWGGFKPDFPNGEVTCEFTGGRCLIPKGPFVLRVPEELSITVSLLDNSLEPITEKITVTSDNVRKFIALKNTPGRPNELTTRFDEIKMLPGGVTELYAAWIDGNGNYLDDVASAKWEIGSDRLAEGISGTQGTRTTTAQKVTFAPKKTGTAYLEVTADNLQLYRPLPVIVPANEFKQWAFNLNGTPPDRDATGKATPPTVKAATCVEIDMYASDDFGNIVPTVKGKHDIVVKIENADTAPVLFKKAHWGEQINIGSTLNKQGVEFVEGLARSIQKACFYDATHPQNNPNPPKITAEAKLNTTQATYLGSLEIKIEKNDPWQIALMRADTGKPINNDSHNICTPVTFRDSSTFPCLVMKMPASITDLTSDEYVKAALLDAAGNFLKYVGVTIEDLSGNLETTTTDGVQRVLKLADERFRLRPTSSSTESGKSLLKISYDAASNTLDNDVAIALGDRKTTIYNYEVVPRDPYELRAFVDRNDDGVIAGNELTNNAVEAGTLFRVAAQLRDSANQLVDRKRTFVNTLNHESEYHYKIEPYDNNNVTFDLAEINPVTADSQCHTSAANTRADVDEAYTAKFSNAKLQLNGKAAKLEKGTIIFKGTDDKFSALRASDGSNGGCSQKIVMRVNLAGTNYRTPATNILDITPKQTVRHVLLRTASQNQGDPALPFDCERITDKKAKDSFHYKLAGANNSVNCHDIMSGSDTSRNLFVAAYDEYTNYIGDKSSVFKFVNTPNLDSTTTEFSAFNASLSPALDYDITHVSPLRGIEASKFSLRANESSSIAVKFQDFAVGAGKVQSGAGHVIARHYPNPANPNVFFDAYSKVFNFSSQTATKYIIDFIEPTSNNNPQVFWSSADYDSVGSVAKGRQLKSSQGFYIRIRPSDSLDNTVSTYRGKKKITLTLPEHPTWGRPNLRPSHTTKLTSTNIGETLYVNVNADSNAPVCDFQPPSTDKYSGTSQLTGKNDQYIVSGEFEPSRGTECIITDKDNLPIAFQLLNARAPYTITYTENEPNSKIGSGFIIAQPIPDNNSTTKIINLANKPGGPDAQAVIWSEKQTSLGNKVVKRFTTNTKTVFQLTADETFEIYPVFTDTVGNYLGEATNVTAQQSPYDLALQKRNRIIEESDAQKKKITFEANNATAHEAQSDVSVRFTDTTLFQNLSEADRLPREIAINIEVSPGTPENLNVRLLNRRLTAGDTKTESSTTVTAGTCLSPDVAVVDTDGNLVRDLAIAADASFGLQNYYSADANILKSKELIHPGGLYKYRGMESVTENMVTRQIPIFVPISNLDSDHQQADLVQRNNQDWLVASSFTRPSEMDVSPYVSYRGTEKSQRIIANGEINLLDRLVCLMDATAGLAPKFKIAVALNANKTIYGESAALTVNAGSPAAIDFRTISGSGTKDRLCQQPFKKSEFPLAVSQNDENVFIRNSQLVCRTIKVTDTLLKIGAFLTDKVGNLVGTGSYTAGESIGTWNISQRPAETSLCPSGSCSGTIELANMIRKGNLAATWNPPGGLSQDLGLRDLSIIVRSEAAEKFKVIAPTNSPTTDNPFGLNVRLLDKFDNEFDIPSNFGTVKIPASITYLGAFLEANGGVNAPDASSGLQPLTPTSVELIFDNSNTAFTDNIFRIRRTTGTTPGEIKFSLVPPALSENNTTVHSTTQFFVLPGTAANNKIYFSDTDPTSADTSSILATNSENLLTTANDTRQIEVRALDESGNIAAAPTVNFFLKDQLRMANLIPHPSLKNSAFINLLNAGSAKIYAQLADNASVKTPEYPIRVAAAVATKVKLVRMTKHGELYTETNGNPDLTSGDTVYFKIVATDDQGNIVENYDHTANPVSIIWNYGNYPLRLEGGRTKLPQCPNDNCSTPFEEAANSCPFVDGVCMDGTGANAKAKIYPVIYKGATNNLPGYLEVTARAPDSTTLTGSFGVIVKPGGFDHYGVSTLNAAGTAPISEINAFADNSQKFRVRVDARDENGNQLEATDQTSATFRTQDIALQILREDGVSAAAGSLNIPTQTSLKLGANKFLEFTNIAYNEPGKFRIFATGPANNGKSTIDATTVLNLKPVEESIQSYRLNFAVGVTEIKAGQETSLRLEALDAFENPVRGIDSSILNTHTYKWNGVSTTSTTSNGLTRPQDVYPTQFNFIDGVATFKIKLHRAGEYFDSDVNLPDFDSSAKPTALRLTNQRTTTTDVSDDRMVFMHPTQLTTNNAAGNITSIRVVPAELKQYNVIATANSTTDTTSLAADFDLNASATTGAFRIVVQPLDSFGNLRKGETGITLVPNKANNALNSSKIRRQNDTNFADSPLNLSTDIPSTSAGYVFNNLYYRVAQPVKWTLAGAGAGVDIVQSVQLDYNAVLDTVDSYRMKINDSTAAVTIVAGDAFNLKLEALDEAENIVTGIDDTLDILVFGVAGPEPINGKNPSPLTTFDFSNGIATKSGVQFFKAQTFLSGAFALNENGSTRQAKNKSTLVISPAAVSTLQADPIPSQKAGFAFALTVRAKDQFGNPSNTNCTDDANNSKTFPIEMKGVETVNGNETDSQLSSSGAGGGAATHAFTSAAGVNLTRAGTNTGLYETSLTLFRKGENKLKFTGCPNISSVSVVMVNESDKANVMRLNNSAVSPAADLAGELECDHTDTTGKNVACPTVYAFLWDRYGNTWRAGSDGVGVCTWSYKDLVPDNPISATVKGDISLATGIQSKIVQTNLSQTLSSNGYMSGNLRCEVAAANSENNQKLYKDVRLFGGLAGLGGRGADNALDTTKVITDPTNVNNIPVGSNNLKITKVTLLQYRGGGVDAGGNVTSSNLQSVNRERTEVYAFSKEGALPEAALPTDLVKNHSTAGDMDGMVSFSFTAETSGKIIIQTRGVKQEIAGISVGLQNATRLKVGNFNKTSVAAGEEITLDSLEALDAQGNRTCNTNTATIEATQLMMPPKCGDSATALGCAVNDQIASIPGTINLSDLNTYALNGEANTRIFTETSKAYWNNIRFKLYRNTLAVVIKIRACNLPAEERIFTVGSGAVHQAQLSTQEDTPTAATTTPEVKCPLGVGLSVRCPTIRGYFWDTYGNRHPTAKCTSWDYQSASADGANKTDDFALAAANTDRTTIFTADANTKYLSGLLTCATENSVSAKAFVYGGLSSIAATYTFGGSGGAETAVAAADNFKITKVTAKFKKPSLSGVDLVEADTPKDDFPAALGETIAFGSADARSLTESTFPIATGSTTFACNFGANGECVPAANVGVLSFRKVEANPRHINISLRGRTFAINNLAVTPRGAHSMQVGLYTQVVNENTRITADNPMTAGASVGAKIRVFDEFNNPTSILKNQTAAAQACVPAANDITGSGLDGNNSRLTSGDRLLAKEPTGVYSFAETTKVSSLNGFTVTKAGTHTLTFKACGLADVTMNVKVNPAAHKHTRVTLSATAPTAATGDNTISQRCTLNAQGSGADCGNVYAWFYDEFYNRIADGISCTDWSYTKRTTAHSSDANKVLISLPTASANTRLSSTDFLDGDLKCDFAGDALDRAIHLYGGIHSVKAILDGNPDNTAATLKAGTAQAVTAGNANAANRLISKIMYLTPTYTDGNYSLGQYPVALPGEDIVLSTNASSAASGTPPAVVTPSFKCDFSATGECTTPPSASAFQLNFTKVEADRTITVAARGKSWTSNEIDVTPGNAAATYSSYTLLDDFGTVRTNNTLVAGEEFGLNFINKDAFGNPTDLDDAGAACAATDSTTSDDPIDNNPNNEDAYVRPTGTGNNERSNETGKFHLRNASISKAGTNQTITFTTCGIARAVTFNVVPNVAKKYVLNKSAAVSITPLEADRCTTLSGNGGATCGNIHAYFYDTYGNHRANDTCDKWTLTHFTGSEAPNPPWAEQSGSSSIQVASIASFDATLNCVKAGATEIGNTAGIHLYGGFSKLEVTVTDNRDGNGKITAGANNFTVNSVKLKGHNKGALVNADYTSTFDIKYTTTASPAPNGTAFTATPTHSCGFTNGICSTAQSFTFAKADDTDKTLTLSVSGISTIVADADSAKLSTIKVAPAAANAASSTHTLLDSGGNAFANNVAATLTADDKFGLNIFNKDAFDNLTDKNTDGTVCNTTTTFTESIANNPKGGDSFVHPTGNDNLKVASTVGTHHLRNMQITRAGTNLPITFTTCGVARKLTFSINGGAVKSFYVTDNNSAVKTDRANSLPCTTLNEGGGATCANIYAYFYDDFDNQRANDTCDKWTLTDINAANTTRPWEEQAASASIQVTSFSALDATLACIKNVNGTTNTTKSLKVYGGFKHLEVTTTDTRDDNGFITAGANNFTVNSIQLKTYVNGALSNASHAGNLTISYSTTASAAPEGTPFTNSPVITCDFNATGLCSTAKAFTFAKADETARTLNISVKGVSATDATSANKLTTIKVKAAAPNSFTTTIPTTVTTDDLFEGEIRLFDAFKNPACDNANLVYVAPGESTQAPNTDNAQTANPSKTQTGIYTLANDSFRLPRVKADGFNLGFTGCGYTASHNVKVTEGALASIKLLSAPNRTADNVTTDTATAAIGCTHRQTSGTGVVCDTVYAYPLDAKGNLVTDTTKQCTWNYVAVSPSTTPAALPAGRQLSISHTAFLDGTVKCTIGALDSTTTPTVRGGISRVALKLAKSDRIDIASDSDSTNHRTVTAGNDNVGVHRIDLFTRAGGTEQAITSASFAFTAEPIEFVTTAVKSVMQNANPVVPANPTCNFSTGVCGTGNNLTTSPVKLSLTRAGGSGLNDIAVKVRGVTSNNISMIVNAGTVTTVTINPVATQIAGTQFNLELKGFDAQENPSTFGCTGYTLESAPSSPTGATATLGTTTVANNVATAPVTLFAAGSNPLTFKGTGCNFTATTTVQVDPKASSKYLISKENLAPSWSTNDENTATQIACTTLNGNNSVTCPNLYAFKYDEYGNKTTTEAANNQTCIWQRKAYGGTFADGATEHSQTFGSTAAVPAMNDVITCKGGSNFVHLWGGPAKLEVTTLPTSTLASNIYTITGTEIQAALGNVTLSKIGLKSQRGNDFVAMPGLNATQNIGFATVGSQAHTFGANAASLTSSDVFTSTITNCTFNENGECFPAASMNFKKLQPSASKFNVTVRGKTVEVVVPPVVAGLAAKLDISGMPSNDDFGVDEYADENSVIALTVTAKDQFDNITTRTSNGAADCNLSVSGNEPGPFADSIQVTNNTTSSVANLKIYKAKAHTLSFSKCGANATRALTILAGATRRSMITRTATQPPIYTCVNNGNHIHSKPECLESIVCTTNNSGTAAGGAGCGTFYGWRFDKAGNYLGTSSCNGTEITAGFVENAGSATESVTSNGTTSFTLSASTTTGFLEGTLRCKTNDNNNDFGGTGFKVLAPVKRAAPTVECTPWMYDANSKPFSLCTFKNNSGLTLTAAVSTSSEALVTDEVEPTFTLPAHLTEGVATGKYGQFIVWGENNKFSSRFQVNFQSDDPTHVLFDASADLRVPLRSLKNDSSTTVSQETAAAAGADITKAEKSEVIYADSEITISAETFARRTWLENFSIGTGWSATCLNTAATGWKCIKDATLRAENLRSDLTDIVEGDGVALRLYGTTSASQQEKINIHPSLTDIFKIDYISTLSDSTNCSNVITAPENLDTSCKYSLQADSAHPEIRGVFWLKDRKGRAFYFMTAPIN